MSCHQVRYLPLSWKLSNSTKHPMTQTALLIWNELCHVSSSCRSSKWCNSCVLLKLPTFELCASFIRSSASGILLLSLGGLMSSASSKSSPNPTLTRILCDTTVASMCKRMLASEAGSSVIVFWMDHNQGNCPFNIPIVCSDVTLALERALLNVLLFTSSLSPEAHVKADTQCHLLKMHYLT